MGYSLDLRERVVKFVESGHSQAFASRIFDIGKRTVGRWLELKKKTGNLKERPHAGGRKPKVQASELKEYIAENPDKTLHEIAEKFDVNPASIWKKLKKLGYVHKKKLYSIAKDVK